MTYSYTCLSGSRRSSQFIVRSSSMNCTDAALSLQAPGPASSQSTGGLMITTIHEASAEVRRRKSNALGNRQYQRRSCVASTQERFDSLLLLVSQLLISQLLRSFLDSRANSFPREGRSHVYRRARASDCHMIITNTAI